MIKQKQRPPLTDIDVGSFSDVSFLLIIFFILTTQIAAFKGNVIDIPSGEAPKSEESKKEKPKQFTIKIDGTNIHAGIDDKEFEGNKNISPADLKARLLAENFFSKKSPEERYVILETDKQVPYDLYFKVVMMIQDTGGYLCLMETDDGPAKGK